MKILMIHPHDIYSDLEPWTVRITSLAREFVNLGHQVKLVYHLLNAAELGSAALRQAFPFETIPLNRHQTTGINKIRIITELAGWADIIHFQKCFSWAAIPAVIAGYKTRKPLHYDWDDWEYAIYQYNPPDEKIGRFLNTMERQLPKVVDTVSVATDFLKKMCLKLGVREDKICEAHVGADLKLFSPQVDGSEIRTIHNLKKNVVLYAGQLSGAQYSELFLQAARIILDRNDDVNFLVVGGGDRFGEIKDLAEKLNITDNVIFTGPVPHEKIPLYMAAADVAVACFEDTDQVRCKSPLKIAEYMASGKAIVASNIGEVPRMLGGSGILTKPGDFGALADGIGDLIRNRSVREELGKKARRRAEDEYNWAVTASNLIHIYESSLGDYKILFKRRRGSKYAKDQGRKVPVPGEEELAPDEFGDAVGTTSAEDKIGGGVEMEPISTIDRILLPRFIRGNLDIIGVLDGENSYCGPQLIQIDLTNRCNNDCIGCWCHSPLLWDEVMSIEESRQTLPLELVKRLIDDLYEMGTRDIYIAGGGEPFMHPQALEIFEYIKDLGFRCCVNTNFTLVGEEEIDRLIEMGMDSLTVSVWAGTPSTYSKTHPNKTEETFEDLRNNLKKLNRLKNQRPYIKIYNVLSSVNYFEISKMVDFAMEVEAEAVEFTMIDTMPGRTDCLLLSEEQRQSLIRECDRIKERFKEPEIRGRLNLFQFDRFLRRISTDDTSRGEYDKNIVESMPCYIGWQFSRILADGNVNFCLKAHRIPVGSLYRNRFRDIWSSSLQKEYRRKANVYKKDDPFFSLIGNDPAAKVGCYKSCDNLGQIVGLHHRIQSLSAREDLILKFGKSYLKNRRLYL